MEKIYMDSGDKSPKKQSFFKKLLNDKGSMTALVVIAFVGIVGLMVFGLNQISFAADLTGQLPEKFTSKQGDENVMRLLGETRSGQDGVLPILGFYTDTDIPIFCIEYNVTYSVGKEYTPGEEIGDYGLIYLMSKIYPNVPFKDADGNELAENIQVWLTQSAIWSYLYETGDPKNSDFVTWNEKVKDVNRLYDSSANYVITADAGKSLYEQFGINTLIEKAKTMRNHVMLVSVSKKSENISVTNDNKFYQTDLISVTGSAGSTDITSFEGYSVNLSKVPEGTILVDESGNQYNDLENMSPTSKFFVRIPVDKVTDENKTLEISVSGKFKTYGANKYVSGEYQKVANVKLLNKNVNHPLTIQLDYTPEVPNTGMGVAQTIYFMGLILLLSGVGIVYANAKPKTDE
ncbi:MAG: thioester domain-containing protein [Bacilli bacterium]|nr:thioester domain-containing protein [Bacilli bacterium]